MAEPIAISCPDCDKPMKVPAEFVGQRIRCKACGNRFTVRTGAEKEEEDDGGMLLPLVEDEPPKPAKKPAAKKPAAKKAARKDDDDDDDGSKEYGYTETDLGHRCPECANEMDSPEAIICLHCGYNTITRIRPEVKKTIAFTFWDWLFWLAPPILSLLSVFVLIGLDVWYCLSFDYERDKEKWYWFLSYGGIKLWLVIISMGIMFFAIRFGLKRLIWHPKPPEKIKWK
jgi:hypothetical protein